MACLILVIQQLRHINAHLISFTDCIYHIRWLRYKVKRALTLTPLLHAKEMDSSAGLTLFITWTIFLMINLEHDFRVADGQHCAAHVLCDSQAQTGSLTPSLRALFLRESKPNGVQWHAGRRALQRIYNFLTHRHMYCATHRRKPDP